MTFSFSRLHGCRSYWLVLLLFALANAASTLSAPAAIGFPFPFWLDDDAGGSLAVTGLLLDIVIAWTLAVLVAWIVLAVGERSGRHD